MATRLTSTAPSSRSVSVSAVTTAEPWFVTRVSNVTVSHSAGFSTSVFVTSSSVGGSAAPGVAVYCSV